MARRGRRSDEGSSADTTDNARPELDSLLDPLPALPVDPVSSLYDFTGPTIPNDRRAFSFGEPERYSLNVGQGRGDSARSDVGAVERSTRLPTSVRFEDASTVAICVRRKERREVLHAKRKIRKGGGSGRRHHWYSKIKC